MRACTVWVRLVIASPKRETHSPSSSSNSLMMARLRSLMSSGVTLSQMFWIALLAYSSLTMERLETNGQNASTCSGVSVEDISLIVVVLFIVCIFLLLRFG